ncbi:MAG: quinol dehydrogenase ferredoxin subunit NapH [Alphaproteobacteria bacterium]
MATMSPRKDAIAKKGWIKAYKWMIVRRFSQVLFLLAFGLYAWWGIALVEGSLNSSRWLGIIPATEPLTFLQTLLVSRGWAADLLIGGAILLILGFIFGARLFCGWICPVNLVSETTTWIKHKFGIKASLRLNEYMRYGILLMVIIASIVGHSLAWEAISPISNTYRSFLFVGLSGLWLIGLVALLDIFVLSENFCKNLCPQGALYSLIGHFRIFGVTAYNKDKCTHCGDCYAVCPEEKILHEPLRGKKTPHVKSGLCTACGQCIDACCENVLKYDFFIKRK